METSLLPSSSSSSSSLRTIVIKPSNQVNSHKKLQFSSDHSLPYMQPTLLNDSTKLPSNLTINNPANHQLNKPTNHQLNPQNNPIINTKSNKTSRDWLPNISIFSAKSNNIKKDSIETFVLSSADQVILKQPTK